MVTVPPSPAWYVVVAEEPSTGAAEVVVTGEIRSRAGVFEAVLGEEDVMIADRLVHASIVDGMRLAPAMRDTYKHSNIKHLESKLELHQDKRVRLVITDGVFSMDGTIANLEAICDLADRYDALVMIDDCHATGFLGESGRGTHEYRGVRDRVDIITGTLGKALGGASGGFTSGRREVVAWLRQRSRPYLFSNSLAPVIAATSIRVLDLLEDGADLPVADGRLRLRRIRLLRHSPYVWHAR